MTYNWQQPEWPIFRFDIRKIEPLLHAYLHEAGKLEGIISALGDADREQTLLELMIAEALNTSAIEGEFMSRADVASSIRNRLHPSAKQPVADRRAIGVGELLFSVRSTFREQLTESMLSEWHATLLAHETRLNVGRWRFHEEPMQVVSGAVGKETIHFEAPPAAQVPFEMRRFIDWFNGTAPLGKDPMVHAPVRAAVAHLYFESIHPFEDGNGRIGRVVAEKALAQTTGFAGLSSLSQTLERDKKAYYQQLEIAQRSNEITSWVEHFVHVVLAGQQHAKATIEFTLKKSRFLDRLQPGLNAAQRRVILRMLEAEPDGFEGGMNATKYSRLTGVSKATATRHLQDLVKAGAVKVEGAARATRYHLTLEG